MKQGPLINPLPMSGFGRGWEKGGLDGRNTGGVTGEARWLRWLAAQDDKHFSSTQPFPLTKYKSEPVLRLPRGKWSKRGLERRSPEQAEGGVVTFQPCTKGRPR